MARPIVSERTKATIADMIAASHDIAATLAAIGNTFTHADRETIEGLRRKYEAFADAATAGKVVDPLALNTLSRLYEDTGRIVRKIAIADAAATVRHEISTATALTLLAASLVESGSSSIFKA